MLSTLLELFAIVCLAAFGFFVWPPLALLVAGGAALLISRAVS